MKISGKIRISKKLLFIAAVIVIVCCMIWLAACDDNTEHDHDWGEWVVIKEPTCIQSGQRQRVCKLDPSHVETEDIAPLGHDLIYVPEQPATCTEDGHSAYYKCSRCFYTEQYKAIHAKGHTYPENEWYHDDYYHWQICSVCGEQSDKKAHEYSHHCVCGLESDYTLGLSFKLLYDGTGYEVSVGKATDTVLKIPSIYNGRDVTSIATAGFRMYECTEVILPDSITSVGVNAFRYCTMSSIRLSENLSKIEQCSFSDCLNLVSVDIPASLKEISMGAFSSCTSLLSVTLHEGLEIIDHTAFWCCKSLSSISIPNTVTTIGSTAFGSTGLTFIIIPGNVVSIGSSAFSYCFDLTYARLEPGLKYLGSGAFVGCSILKDIELPDGILEIGVNPVYDTPDYNAYIERARNDHSFVKYSINDYLLAMSDTFVREDDRAESITIEGFSIIADKAVSLIAAKYINISDSVTYIGIHAFADCYELVSVRLSENITEIKEESFMNCFKLESVSIPNSVETIGYKAFYNCKKLTKVYMPDHPVHIKRSAFENTGVMDDESFWIDGVLYLDGHLISGNNFTGEEYTVLPGTYSIAEYAFYSIYADDFHIKELVLPDSVEIIGIKAFGGCYDLEYITISQNLRYIGEDAFAGETLNPFELPQSLEYIGPGNFSKKGFCSSSLPEKLTVIEEYAFYGSAFEGLLVLPDNIKSVKKYAFSECRIDEIIIPKDIEYFDISAFSYSEIVLDQWGNSMIITNKPEFFYQGTESDWENVDVRSGDVKYLPFRHGKIDIYFYSETQPTEEGSFWHYVDGSPVIWE